VPLVVPTTGAVEFLELLRGPLNAKGPRIQLYQNDIVPSSATVFADFVPCNFDGYPGDTIINFPDPAFSNFDGQAEIDAPPVAWTCTGDSAPQRVFGYYVFLAAGPVLLWAQRFDGRTFMRSAGDFLSFAPILQASSIY